MTLVEQARQALDLSGLQLPPSPRIVRLEVQDYVDASGEEALQVWAILDEGVTDAELLTDRVLAIDTRIRDSLLAQGVKLFPYVSFAKQSELDEVAAEE